MNDTIQIKITRPYFEIFGEQIESNMSITNFLNKLGIKDIVKAKMLEKKYYNPKDDSYGPFDGSNEAIEFLKRYN